MSLHWPSGDGVFTEVKKFFPIYPGANLPPSLKLSTAPPANLDSFHPQFRLWYEAMKYLHDHNESQSIHSHAHIFSADTIPTDRFPDSDLATHLTYSPSTVSAFAAEVPTYKALFKEFKRHSALSTVASTNHVTTQEAPAAPLPAGAPFDSELFAQIMANALKGANASTKEKDLARTSANAFATFLEIGSIKEALRHLHDTFAHITDTLTTRNNYDHNVDFDIALFQHATVTALKTCSFGVRPLTMHPHEATSLPSLLAWLPPNKNDVRYTNFLSEGRDIIRQEAMEEDKSKQAAKKTDIFVHGDVSSVEALIKMLANFFAFVKYYVKDFTFDDPPLIITLLEDFMNALHPPAAKDWIRYNAAVPHFPLCLLLEMNQILQIVLGAAKNKTTQCNLRNGQPIMADTFVNAFNGVTQAISHINLSISMGNLGPSGTCPNLHAILNGKPTPAPKRESPNSREQPNPTKRAKHPPQGTHPGYLTYDGPGRLPIAPFKCKHPITGKQAAFCSHFLFANYHCNRPRCHNIHYTKQFAATMGSADTEAFEKFIEKNPWGDPLGPKASWLVPPTPLLKYHSTRQ
ncbi:unnamed protein product [Cylindrotheca closterium]|uniref:Uncharacterized protein n=1 Tax=Cylindrotheca closterium TaxID=2856 RepID=A0AAD2CC91_9STRA|nr:unnamed protein product [Cylindrotheca closterium]